MIDAYAVFAHARLAVAAAKYPRRIDYTIAIAGRDGAVPKTNHYRASCLPAQGTVDVAEISNEEAAKPARAPRGFNFAFTASVCGGNCSTGSGTVAVPAGRTASSEDLIGVPILAPTYMFGMRSARETDRDAPEQTPSDLPVIAVVSTSRRDYQITLLDTPQIDGASVYHLRLTPLRKPKVNRLRELWIGESDFLPRKAIVAGNFTLAPLVDVPWTVNFAVVSGAPFITRESAGATLYLAHRRVVRDATISFEDVREAKTGLTGRPLLTPAATETTLVEPGV